METRSHERGQALILIVFAILGLFGITALAVDGGMAYSDRRNAQNAADSAALAAALADIRGRDANTTATSSAAADGFDDNQTSNWVTISSADAPSGSCQNTPTGKDITVQIKSILNTYFGPVIGIRQVTNTVTATARACEPYFGPLFNGDAIVALTKGGIGFDARGTPDWHVTGGGIFSNSSDSPSASCKGAASIIAPSLTSAGNVDLKCSTQIPQIDTGAAQLQYSDYSGMLPRIPTCDGTAKHVGSFWVAEAGADGSKVALDGGDMQFGPGLFCITNSPGPYHGKITGNGVTFYVMRSDFNIDFNGGGGKGGFGAPLTASTLPGYVGVLIFAAPQLSGGELQNTQHFGFYGNGNGNVQGSIILPSASVTMFGNSDPSGYHTQIIAYNVDTGGNANININYNKNGGFLTQVGAEITLLR